MNSSGFQSRLISHGAGSDRQRDERPSLAGAPRAIVEKIRSFGPQKKRDPLTRAVQAVLGVIGGGVRWLIREKNRLGWKMFLLRVFGIGFGAGVLYLGILWIMLPDIGDASTLFASQSSVIVDRNGVELYRLFEEEDRTLIPGDQIPEHMKEAIIAIEDERFYGRGCIDIRAVGRVFFRLGQGGGASTLTRQLARNALHLQQDNIINRKLKELILGCKLETLYDKKKILELYLNWIPFGQNAYGIEQASQKYFGKAAKDLTIAESAVLAALPQRPSYFNPYGKRVKTQIDEETFAEIASGEIESAADIQGESIIIGLLGNTVGTGANIFYLGGRTDQVLRNMQEQKYITEQERLAALEELEKIQFKPGRENIRAPHFVLWIREQLDEMFKDADVTGILEQGGLIIETTLDWELQQAAEKAVNFHKQDMLSFQREQHRTRRTASRYEGNPGLRRQYRLQRRGARRKSRHGSGAAPAGLELQTVRVRGGVPEGLRPGDGAP